MLLELPPSPSRTSSCAPPHLVQHTARTTNRLHSCPRMCATDLLIFLIPGTCVIDLDISPGARNRVAGSTLTSIAQSVISTCTSPTIFQGGWGAYGTLLSPASSFTSFLIMPRPVTKASSVQSDAKRNHIADIAIVISSPSSPFRSPEERDPEHTSPVLNSTDSTAARSGSAQELAFFRGSFWARGLVMINFPVCLIAPSPFPFLNALTQL